MVFRSPDAPVVPMMEDMGVTRQRGGVVLLGGGGHARVVGESLRLIGIPIAGVCDDDPTPSAGEPPLSLATLGPLGILLRDPGFLADRRWMVAVGSVEVRRRLIDAIESVGEAISVAHPSARVSPSAAIGAGTWIGPGAIVHTAASVGEHVIVNSGAVVEHDCRLGDNVHVAPGAVLAGEVVVGRDTLIGLGARVLPRVQIGAGCTIGAGSVVVHDVADGAAVMGVPARSR